MKTLVLVTALFLTVLAGTAFAAFIYWGHPYLAINHQQNGSYVMGEDSPAFSGCPYLQQLHEGVEPYGGDDFFDFKGDDGIPSWQGPSLSPESGRGREVIEI